MLPFGPPRPPMAGLPFDLQTEQEEIQRQRQLAQILRQQALTPGQDGQMVSGHFVANPWAGVGKMAQAYFSRNLDEGADADTRALTERYNRKLAEGMDRYFQTRAGRPGVPGQAASPGEFIPTEDDLGFRTPGTPGREAVPAVRGDPRRAAVEAMTSGLPALARLGQSDLEALSKGMLTPKELLTAPKMTGPSRVAASQANDPSLLRPEPNTVTINDRVYDLPDDGSSPRERFDASDVYSQPHRIPGAEGWYVTNTRTNQPKRIDGAGTTVRVDNNNPNRKIPAELAGSAVKALEGFTQSATASARALSALENVKRATVGTGGGNVPFPNAAIWFGQLANAFGVRVDQQQLANAETFQSEVVRLWAELMAQNGGARGLVKEESDRLMASLPSLAQTPQGRMQIVEVLEQQARANIETARQSGRLIGEALSADNPTALTEALVSAIQPPSSITPRPAVSPQLPGGQPGGRSPRVSPAVPAGGWQPGQQIAPGVTVIRKLD